MGYIQGEGRNQGTLFPVVLDDFVPADHMCRVIDAFVETLGMSDLGFERARAAETGRPGYNPRDLLKLYLYGYLNQVRSARFGTPDRTSNQHNIAILSVSMSAVPYFPDFLH
jgi:transposase